VAGGFEKWRIASDEVVVKENQGVCVSLLMLEINDVFQAL